LLHLAYTLNDKIAFKDFGRTATGLKDSFKDWSFSDYLNTMKETVDRNVLILGQYRPDMDFDSIKKTLKRLGYCGFLLEDSPDLSIQISLEKLFTAIGVPQYCL
jgi:hypothetical protein